MKEIFQGWKIIEELGKDNLGPIYKIMHDGGRIASMRVLSVPASPSEYDRYIADGMDKDMADRMVSDKVQTIIGNIELMSKVNECILPFEEYKTAKRDDGKGENIFVRFPYLPSFPVYYGKKGIKGASVITLGIQICRALEFYEKKGIVHGEIKLQNIYVEEDPSGTVNFRLGDWGISSSAVKMSTYIAPEVHSGKRYDIRADIYSLSLVIYWLLNDRRMPFLPLPPETPTPSQMAEANKRRLSGEAIMPPKNGSENLKKIILKGVSFKESERYSNPSEMRMALEKEYEIIMGAVKAPVNTNVGLNTAALHADSEPTIRLKNSTFAPTMGIEKTLKMPSENEDKISLNQQNGSEDVVLLGNKDIFTVQGGSTISVGNDENTAPPNGENTAPPNGENTAPPDGENTVPLECENTIPLEGEKTVPLENRSNPHLKPSNRPQANIYSQNEPEPYRAGAGGKVSEKKKGKKGKIIFIIVIIVLLLAAASVGAMYFLGVFDKGGSGGEDETTSAFDSGEGGNDDGNYSSGESSNGEGTSDDMSGESESLSEDTSSDSTQPPAETSNDVTEDASNDTSDDATSEDTTSEDATSEDTTSEDTTSDDTASDDTTSDDTTSDDTTSEDTTFDDTTSEDTSEGHSHEYSQWVVTKEPGCESMGRKERSCKECGATEILMLPVTGHTYVDGVCSDCGDKE